jgi:serine/threonine protein kinase
MIGQLLTKRYLILEKLGGGGFSETYLARDKYLPQHPLCVVKCLKLPEQSPISQETARRLFETEAHLLEQFGKYHAQIPTLFAYCQEQDSPYLVQEYIEGETLSTAFSQKQRFTAQAAIALLQELLPVLDYIHSHHVVHCDVTPSNLIRRHRDGKIVLIDFGAAYLCSDRQTAEADPAPLLEIGTPGYMPEEQRLGTPEPSSDLYGLGMLVIHLLTQVDPRQFKEDVISGELDWQSYLKRSSIPPSLISILDRMVRSRVSDRYQQASEVLADLQATHPSQRARSRTATRWQAWAQQMWVPASALLLIGAGISQLSKFQHRYGSVTQSALHQMEQRMLPPAEGQLTMVREISLKRGVDRLLIAPNKRVMATVGTDQLLRLWTLPNGKWLKTLMGNSSPITTVAFSPNSQFLVLGRDDGSLQLWDATSGDLRQELSGHQKSVIAIAISPDLRILTSSSKDRTVRQWNLQTGALLRSLSFPQSEVTAITYPVSADQLITASRDRQIRIWNLRNGQIQRTFSGHAEEIVGLEMVNPHMLISMGKDRGLMWDLNREALAQALPDASADSMMVSKCNRNLITVHRNGNIRVWIPENGQFIMQDVGRLEDPKNIAFSPNHEYLVTWNADKRLRFWQIQDRKIN